MEVLMNEEMKQNLKNPGTWNRFVYMLLFFFCCCIAEALFFLIVVFQFIITLFTSTQNSRLKPFSRDLSSYVYDVLQFLSYNSDQMPFPFSDWPGER